MADEQPYTLVECADANNGLVPHSIIDLLANAPDHWTVGELRQRANELLARHRARQSTTKLTHHGWRA